MLNSEMAWIFWTGPIVIPRGEDLAGRAPDGSATATSQINRRDECPADQGMCPPSPPDPVQAAGWPIVAG